MEEQEENEAGGIESMRIAVVVAEWTRAMILDPRDP